MPGDTLFFFASLCLFLSSVEYAVPKPLPFMRLGLANLPVIFAVKSFRFRDILILILLKVLLASFISGTTFSYVFLFSAAGSFASGLAVYILYHMLKGVGFERQISNVGLCLAGALANNAAQIAVARICIFGKQAYFIAPLLLATGLVTGLLLGLFANTFEEQSSFLTALRSGSLKYGGQEADGPEQSAIAADADTPDSQSGGAVETLSPGTAAPVVQPAAAETGQEAESGRQNRPRSGFPATRAILIACTVAIMLALPFVPSLPLKAGLWSLLLAADEMSRKGKVRLLPSFILILSLTALSLCSPSGKVLHVIGSFRITEGALKAGLAKALTLTGMLFASQTLFASFRALQFTPAAGAHPSARRFFRPLSRVFTLFGALSEHRLDLKGKGIIAALDARLFEVWQQGL